MRTPAHLATLVLPLLVVGCSLLPFHHKEPSSDTQPEQVEPVSLHVINHNWSDVVVYAMRGTSSVRLGDLTTGMQADYVVPRSLTTGGQVTVRLHLIGGADYSTGPILVSPGQVIYLRIENVLAQTNWSIS